MPTLTIVISNMGDTVIKGIRDLTIWLGAFTVLPGDESMRDKVKDAAKKVKSGAAGEKQDGDIVEEQPGGVNLPEQDRDPEKAYRKRGEQVPGSAASKATDKMGSAFETEELEDAEEAKSRGDKLSEDMHLYHYLLVKEIRKVMKDVNEETPIKYSYSDWAYIMRLLGQDEADSHFHRKAPAQAPPQEELGSAGKQTGVDKEGESGDKDSAVKSTGQSTQWSWVGARSPLMGEQSEPAWVLERLSERLEDLLRAERDKSREERKKRGGQAGEESAIQDLKSHATIPETQEEEDQ